MAEVLYPYFHENACTYWNWITQDDNHRDSSQYEHMDYDLSTINDPDSGRRSDLTNAGDNHNMSRSRDKAHDLYTKLNQGIQQLNRRRLGN